ncbi:hypothetical protein L9F63_005946 [Diploptera punctata]|uniref:Takeout n=1 Tax=Diploptera punctata TaxID=6984 RepID=A0AAD7ZB40_DIPPU|nr:hypothetical protein L9F63_005946 [Diploptera punctata]
MKQLTALYLLALCLEFSHSLKLPDYITPCHRYDPNINACALKSARETIPHVINGDPKYKVPPLDPVLIKELVVSQGSSSVGLTLAARDAYLRGVKDVEIRDLDFNFKDQTVYFEWYFPKLQIDCIYNVTGRVLLLPIEGYGNGTISLNKVRSNYTYDWEIIKKKDGKEYVTVTKAHLTFDPEKFQIHLENLFNGNKLLGDNMNRFMNENWRDILKDVGPAVAEAVGEYIRLVLNSIYKSVPYEDVFIFDPV